MTIEISKNIGKLKVTNEELEALEFNNYSDQELSELVTVLLDGSVEGYKEIVNEVDKHYGEVSAVGHSVSDLVEKKIDICTRNANGLVVMSRPIRILVLAGIFSGVMELG